MTCQTRIIHGPTGQRERGLTAPQMDFGFADPEPMRLVGQRATDFDRIRAAIEQAARDRAESASRQAEIEAMHPDGGDCAMEVGTGFGRKKGWDQ